MKHKIYPNKLQQALLITLTLTVLIIAIALADGGVDAVNKWAWGSNIGWVNLNDANSSVTIYSDHLEGYAWGENVGWIRMGTATSGSPHNYSNTDETSYGVNNDGVGNLSGYAWGANIGWINFNPADSRVWIDPVTGNFEGEAWGENVGWIRFNGTAQDATAYKSNSRWRGNLLPAYENDITAIITNHRTGAATSTGLRIADSSFLNQAGDGITFGHNNAAFAGDITTNLGSSGADKRWARIWQLDINNEGGNGGNFTMTFDISDAGGSSAEIPNFDSGGVYFLLKRAAGSNDNFTNAAPIGSVALGDQLTFTVNGNTQGAEFTVGEVTGLPTAVSLQSTSATTPATGWLIALFGVLLLTMGGLWRRQVRR